LEYILRLYNYNSFNVYIFITCRLVLKLMMMIKIIDFILNLIETYSGKINGWAWNKRWKDRQSGTGYRK